MAPSSWLHFPWDRFRRLSCSWQKDNVAWLAQTPVQKLWVDTLVGIGRLVPPPWRSDFSRLRPLRCIFEIALDFIGTFQFLRLFLGALHALWVVAWVVWRHKRESCLFHVTLWHHRQRKVSMLASSKVRHHGRCIPTYQLMYLNQSFSCRFSTNIWKDGRRKIYEEFLDADRCPHYFVSDSCCAWQRVRPLVKFV